jgi:hypothetical protein
MLNCDGAKKVSGVRTLTSEANLVHGIGAKVVTIGSSVVQLFVDRTSLIRQQGVVDDDDLTAT